MLTYAAPYIQQGISAALSFRDSWSVMQYRVEQLEERMQKLERRGRFFHGRETPVEAQAEAKN